MNIDIYLTQDHRARRRTTYIGIATGVIAGAGAEALGAKPLYAFAACVTSTGAVEIFRALSYKVLSEKVKREPTVFPFRRVVLQGALSVISALLLRIFDVPAQEVYALEREIERISNNPSDAENIRRARRLIADASAARIRLGPSTVQKAGSRFISASTINPSAWDAALAFASYRTSYNFERTVHLRPAKVGTVVHTMWWIHGVAGEPVPALSYRWGPGPVEPEEAAIMATLGSDEREQRDFGAMEIILTGNVLNLNDTHLKHVIVQNAKIYYSGHPVLLEDVIFWDCIVAFENTAPSRQLSQALLASSAVNFESSRS